MNCPRCEMVELDQEYYGLCPGCTSELRDNAYMQGLWRDFVFDHAKRMGKSFDD